MESKEPVVDPYHDAFEALSNISEGLLVAHTGIERLANALLTARDDQRDLRAVVNQLEHRLEEQGARLALLLDRFDDSAR